MFKKLAFAATAVVLFSTNAEARSTLLYTGTSLTEDSDYSYIGGLTALNSDLDKDGFLVRATLAAGGYEYSRSPSSNVEADLTTGDFMLGYQSFLENNSLTAKRLTFFTGVDYQDHDLSPSDPANDVNGSETGAKFQLEAEFAPTASTNLNIIGSYSTAYDSYWAKTQFGCDKLGVNIGPEVTFLGSDSYDQQRYGAFVNEIDLVDTLSLGVSAGYSESSRRGDDGIYGEVGLSYSF